MSRRPPDLAVTALAAGSVALLAAAAAAVVFDARELSQAWLVGALFWSAFPIGALAVLCVHALTGGGWGEETGPTLRAAAATLPLAALFILPLALFALHDLFPWTAPEETLPEVVRRKGLYLDIPFFLARSALYLAVWLLLAWRLGVWGSAAPGSRTAGAAGAVGWVLTVTFFSFDWLMSLEPKWYSDIFGLLFGASLVQAAMALALLTAARAPRNDDRRTARLQDFANLWLAVLVGWVFLHFSQYLIIWSANLPDEIEWFVHRSTGGWRIVAWAVVLLVFAIPFIALLSGRLKRDRRVMGAVAGIALGGHLALCIWLVLPSFHREGFALPWLTPVVWAGLGGPWLYVFLRRREAILRQAGDDARPRTATVSA